MDDTTFKKCLVDICPESAATIDRGRKGYCRLHYRRLRDYGDPLYFPRDKPPMTVKLCVQCDTEKPATAEFWNKRKDGRGGGWSSPCIECKKANRAQEVSARPKTPTQRKRSLAAQIFDETGTWACSRCGEYKLVTTEFFRKTNRGPTGFSARCKVCDYLVREQRKIDDPEWWAATRERERAYHETWVDPNPDKTKERQRLYRENNLEACRQRTRDYMRRQYKRALRHHVSQERYEAMMLAQGGVCAIQGCGRTGGEHGLDVDHDHACCPGNQSCGQCVRGLVCGQCNRAMGQLDDDVTRILGLIGYLEGGNRILLEAREWVALHPQHPWTKGQPRPPRVRSFELYNTNQELYDAMLMIQGGTCAVKGCGRTSETRRMDTDHDHACCPDNTSCGECVRGLLCGQCNKALGSLKDDPVRISALADYLIMGGFQYDISIRGL